MSIAEKIAHIHEAIAAACARSGRQPESVMLIGVSKTQPQSAILEAAAAGLQHFGENRVEECQTRIPAVNALLQTPVIWHMIGHIQSRKAKLVPGLFQVVHSVDSLKLAAKLSQSAQEGNTQLEVLLEINISGEENKQGLNAQNWAKDAAVREALWQEIAQIAALPALKLSGLMTMAPIVEEAEQARPVFAGLAALRESLSAALNLPLPALSMGMTDDYPVAIEEGATMIRVGRAIFGERII